MSLRSKKSFSEGGPGGSKKYHVDSLKLGNKAAKRKSSPKRSTVSSKHSHDGRDERLSPKCTASDFGGKKHSSKAKEKAKESKSHSRPRSRSRSRSGSKKSKGAYEFEDATSSSNSSSSSDQEDERSDDSESNATSSIASSHHSSHRRRGREEDKRRSSKHRTASRDTDDRRHHVKDKNKHSRGRSRSREKDRDKRRRSSSRGDKQYRHRSRDEHRATNHKEREHRNSSHKKPYVINKYNIPLMEAHHGKRPTQAEIRLPREDGEDIFVIGPGVGRQAAARRKKARERTETRKVSLGDRKKQGISHKRKRTSRSLSGWPVETGKSLLSLIWKSVKHRV